jgi:hypothetical protein
MLQPNSGASSFGVRWPLVLAVSNFGRPLPRMMTLEALPPIGYCNLSLGMLEHAAHAPRQVVQMPREEVLNSQFFSENC